MQFSTFLFCLFFRLYFVTRRKFWHTIFWYFTHFFFGCRLSKVWLEWHSIRETWNEFLIAFLRRSTVDSLSPLYWLEKPAQIQWITEFMLEWKSCSESSYATSILRSQRNGSLLHGCVLSWMRQECEQRIWVVDVRESRVLRGKNKSVEQRQIWILFGIVAIFRLKVCETLGEHERKIKLFQCFVFDCWNIKLAAKLILPQHWAFDYRVCSNNEKFDFFKD